MGKKPVVTLVGLVWAGMALAGCQNCKNCRDKFKTAPTFQTKNTGTTPQGGPGLPATGEGAVVSGDKASPTAKAQDLPGTDGFAKATPAPEGGPGTAKPAATPVSNPNTRTNMRPGDDLPPRLNEQPGLPGRNDNMGGSSEMPGGRVSSNSKMDFPATPVIQPVAAQKMMPAVAPANPAPPLMPPEGKLSPGIRDLPPLVPENNPPTNPAATSSSPPLPDMPGTMVPPPSPPPGLLPLMQ